MTAASAKPAPDEIPLCVDLDGSLLRSDTLWEFIATICRESPFALLQLPFRFLLGLVGCKRALAERYALDVTVLPYNKPLLAWLIGQKAAGRRLVLATACDQRVAETIANHLGIFDDVIGSDGHRNNKGRAKLRSLQEHVGDRFDYVGDSNADLEIWRHSRYAILVEPSSRLERQANSIGTVADVFRPDSRKLSSFLKVLRPHQWSKNLLLLLPVIASHQIDNSTLDRNALTATIAFSFCASAAYIVNDIVDLSADRHHPSKRLRPFASGDLPLVYGFVTAPALLLVATLCMSRMNISSAAVLLVYFLFTLTYSMQLKRLLLVDVFALAGLYVIRIIAGGLVNRIHISPWLLSFSFLAFLSLAFCKRAIELQSHTATGLRKNRRPYQIADLPQLHSFGISAGFFSTLVLALYISGEEVHILYRSPYVLWILFPLALFWFLRIWIFVRRDRMHEDPVLFAVKDRFTWLTVGLAIVIIYLASLPLSVSR